MLGIFRKSPHGGGRLEPVDKKMLGKELSIPAGSTAHAEDGEDGLISVEQQIEQQYARQHRHR